MDSAPIDREIVGRNSDGDVAVIWSEKVHPSVDRRFWCKGEDAICQNWLKMECFYPVEWRERDEEI